MNNIFNKLSRLVTARSQKFVTFMRGVASDFCRRATFLICIILFFGFIRATILGMLGRSPSLWFFIALVLSLIFAITLAYIRFYYTEAIRTFISKYIYDLNKASRKAICYACIDEQIRLQFPNLNKGEPQKRLSRLFLLMPGIWVLITLSLSSQLLLSILIPIVFIMLFEGYKSYKYYRFALDHVHIPEDCDYLFIPPKVSKPIFLMGWLDDGVGWTEKTSPSLNLEDQASHYKKALYQQKIRYTKIKIVTYIFSGVFGATVGLDAGAHYETHRRTYGAIALGYITEGYYCPDRETYNMLGTLKRKKMNVQDLCFPGTSTIDEAEVDRCHDEGQISYDSYRAGNIPRSELKPPISCHAEAWEQIRNLQLPEKEVPELK